MMDRWTGPEERALKRDCTVRMVKYKWTPHLALHLLGADEVSSVKEQGEARSRARLDEQKSSRLTDVEDIKKKSSEFLAKAETGNFTLEDEHNWQF